MFCSVELELNLCLDIYKVSFFMIISSRLGSRTVSSAICGQRKLQDTFWQFHKTVNILVVTYNLGRAIAQAVSRWLPTAAVWGSKPDLGMWDLWWDKVALGRFSPSTSVSPAIIVRSTNYSTITLIYHPGKMHNRPMCGRSTGTYKSLGDLQRDLRGLSPTPPNKKKNT
jgi:hypothetical protein